MNGTNLYGKLLYPFNKPIGEMVLWDNGSPRSIDSLFEENISLFNISKPIVYKNVGLQRLKSIYSIKVKDEKTISYVNIDNITEIQRSKKVWYQDLPNPTGIRTRKIMQNDYLSSDFPLMMPVDSDMIWIISSWSDYLFASLWYSLYEPYFNRRKNYNTRLIGANSRISKEALLIPPYIIGNNVTIEPGAIISGSIVGNNSRIGQASIVRNSILAEGVSLPIAVVVFMSVINSGCVVNSNIRFSVLDKNVFIGGNVIISDMLLSSNQNSYRDKRTIIINEVERKTDSNAVLLGCAIGDNARIGANVFLKPGASIMPNSRVLP